MKNKVQKIWDFIFKNDANLQKITLQISGPPVNVATKLQKIFLNRYLSTTSDNSPHNISNIIGPYPKKRGKNATH